MTARTCLSVVLAAGEGTRMKSSHPKVLHPIAGRPMVAHVIDAAIAAGGSVAIVAGHGADAVTKAIGKLGYGDEVDTTAYIQRERLGTAHAVLSARPAIEKGFDDLLIMFGDTPLIDVDALRKARARLTLGAAVVVMGFRTPNPTGYGRLIVKDGELAAIREERDCTEEERAITFCNGGLMAVAGEEALSLLDAVGNANAKGEYYLTDIVEIARSRGLRVVAEEVSFDNVLGVNTRVELAEAEALWQRKKRRELMIAGVSLVAPETVFLSWDTEIGQDTLVEPNVVFGPGVSVAAGATIHAFSHLEGARVETGAQVGPYARLRPGADLQRNSKVGNFCEVKQATIEEGAKVNHLTYIGDARVGANANIGAGTITCNYDGYTKAITDIGIGAFIGSNSSLVAPIRIGDGAYVASGSTVTDDVPADALAFGRARQTTIPERGRQLRERLAAAKKPK